MIAHPSIHASSLALILLLILLGFAQVLTSTLQPVIDPGVRIEEPTDRGRRAVHPSQDM